MNRTKKIILSILAGIDVTFYIFTPIIIAVLWYSVSNSKWGSVLIFILGFFATIFRAIKIGWLK